jgi:hypothetical protein
VALNKGKLTVVCQHQVWVCDIDDLVTKVIVCATFQLQKHVFFSFCTDQIIENAALKKKQISFSI